MIPTRQEEIIEAAEICIKYEGYIEREKLIADKSPDLKISASKANSITVQYNKYRSKLAKNWQKLTRKQLLRHLAFPGFHPATSTFFWYY